MTTYYYHDHTLQSPAGKSACFFIIFSKSIPSVLVRLSMTKSFFAYQPLEFVLINKTMLRASTDVPPHHCTTICLASPSCIKLPGTSSKSSFYISPLCDITLQLISLSTSACWASRILGSFFIKKRWARGF